MSSVSARCRITGRGTVVVLDGVTDPPVGRPSTARVTRPDGSCLDAVAYKGWPPRSGAKPVESEHVLLRSVEKADIPEGGLVALTP